MQLKYMYYVMSKIFIKCLALSYSASFAENIDDKERMKAIFLVFFGLISFFGTNEGKTQIEVSFNKDGVGQVESPFSCDFAVWDIDGDGSVDFEEFTRQLTKITGVDDSKTLFKIADTNNDSRMSEEELRASAIVKC